jgi:hypothetical protein
MLRWIRWVWIEFQKDRQQQQRWKEQEQRIEQLSIEQARAEALQVLQDESVFRLVPVSTPPNSSILAQLPEEVRELAAQYEQIQMMPAAGEDTEGLDFGRIVPAELREGYLRIGQWGIDTDVYTEVVVRLGDRGVYELCWSETEPTRFHSVYHWILWHYWHERISREVEEQYTDRT